MTVGAGSNSPLNVFPASSSLRTPLFDAPGFMLADLEAGPPAMPYRPPPAPVQLGMPPGVAPPMPGYQPMGQPAHLHGPPPIPFVPCVPMPMGVPGMHSMPAPGFGLPAHVQHNLQYPQQVQPPGLQAQQLQPPPAHPTWQERFGQPAQLQQQQQGVGPGPQQHQPGLAAAASGDQDAGLQQLQHPPAEQQQDPGRQGGLRLRIVMPRGMQQRLSSPGEQAQQQQQPLPQDPQHGPAAAAASGQAGLQVPPPPPPFLQHDQQQEQPGQEAAAAAAGRPQAPLTRAQRKSAQHQQQREAATAAAAAAAAALRGSGPGAGHGQPAAAAAAEDARMPPGLRTVRFRREVTQVDIIMGAHQQQQQRSSAAPGAGNQQQQQRAGYGVAPLRGATAAGQGPLQPEQYFKQYAVDTNPFWGSALPHNFAGVLATTTLQPPAGRTPGSTAMATCDLAVTLSAQQVQQLQARTAAVQLWCFKLGDTVPYRVHWPYTNQQLLVNDARAAPVMAKRLKVGELQPHQVRLLAERDLPCWV